MRITITARVDFGPGWDENSQSEEISIDLEHDDYLPLPWAAICERLIEHTIRAREIVEEAKEAEADNASA